MPVSTTTDAASHANFAKHFVKSEVLIDAGIAELNSRYYRNVLTS